MGRSRAWLCGVVGLGAAACSQAADVSSNQATAALYQQAEAQVAAKAAQTEPSGAARNVILFVGDGMGVSTMTAARILAGQRAGTDGEANLLRFEALPHTALVKTYNTDQQTPDSAGTMTAMVTGVKSRAGVLSVAQNAARGDCAAAKDYPLTTVVELAERAGMATGVVTTARLTHATPAATYAHSAERNWEDNSALPESAVAAGCSDIAAQFVDFDEGDGIDVAFGGGRRHFLPQDVSVEGSTGRCTDGRNLVAEWQTKYPGGAYVDDEAAFSALSAATHPVLGLFESSHMRFEADRANDVAGEPSLSEMTAKAIDILQAKQAGSDKGYLLVVESGRIDHAHHAGNAFNALNETVEYADAVGAALDKVNTNDTLVLVTADHSHVFTIAGYPKRGNPILGKVVGVGSDEPTPAADNMPYTTLGYTNGQGFANLGGETNAEAIYAVGGETGRQSLAGIDTTMAGYHQEALIPLGAETHAGEDISVHGIGPGADLLSGVIEQNVLFHIIDRSAALNAAGY